MNFGPFTTDVSAPNDVLVRQTSLRTAAPSTAPLGATRRPQTSMKRQSILILAVAFSLSGCGKSTPSSVLGDASHPALVHVYTVAEETTQRRVQATGSLFPFEESIVSAQVEGRISQVLADVGDSVKEGQPLIVIDPQELQFEVDRQRGIVKQVRAQLGIGPGDPPPADPKTLALRATRGSRSV